MKKVDTIKKNPTNDVKQSQRKISLYFSKATKNEAVLSKDQDKIIDLTDVNDTNEQVCKKRKILEDLEYHKNKITNYGTGFSACNAQNRQKQKSDMMHNVFDNSNVIVKTVETDWEDVSVIEYEIEENIDINKCKNVACKTNRKETMRSDVRSLDENFDKCLTAKEKIVTDIEKSKHNSSIEKYEEIDLTMSEEYVIDDFNDCFDEEWSVDNQINFSSLQRYKIIGIKRECNSLVLTVEHEQYKTSGTVSCLGYWKDAKVQKDDIIAVQGREENGRWIVDNNSGFLVVHPDVLISGTTLSNAVFCTRKSVFSEKFKKLDQLPYVKVDQSRLVVGSLVHEVIQRALQQDIRKLSDVSNLIDCILETKDTTSMLYASEMTLDACKQEMLVFVPKIFAFFQHYLKGKKQQEISSMRNNFKGSITHIRDIEENIWLPTLGVKGKIDVSVEVKINSEKKIMPLEIKTGRPSFSLEHRGQIIIYIMMMALTGQDTDTGLLLYLRENNMQEINTTHHEKRDLILLRNTLAHYLAVRPVQKSTNLISESNFQLLDLPDPINHPVACSRCSYNTLCCTYLSKDTKLKLPEIHPLTILGKQILEKFKPTHIDYVLRWISLLQMEESAQSREDITRYLWTLSPEKREAKKICICNLKLIGKVTEHNSKHKHTFVRANVELPLSVTKIPYMEFADNEYILVSTDTRINIAAGFIVQRKEDSITVLLDRNLTKCDTNELFHIDKYSSSSLFSFNLTNVAGLLGVNETCEKLREIIIDRKPATFKKGISHSMVIRSAKIMKNLNENQQRALLGVISTNDYVLIKGMPGTGKTETLVTLIELLQSTGNSVIITAHTNSAVDNILLKLMHKGIDFLRLGSNVHSFLKHKSDGYVTSGCHTPESLEKIYSSKNIVGVTCYGASHPLLGKRTFDYCIVDESTQALQSAVLRPLYSAKKFVLTGDPQQLPPIIKSKEARKLGGDESLFARLDDENNTIVLTKQYRMNKNIMYLANKLTYNDMLEAGNKSVENATFVAPCSEVLKTQERWIQKVLSSDINDSVIVLNTGCISNLKTRYDIGNEYLESTEVNSNIWEAVIILKLVKTLLKMKAKPENIGIIAPYRAHVNLLKRIITGGIEINTVDQYQGRDKEIIIYSCAKSLVKTSDIKEDFEILGDHRRLTVAITRAKHKLIVIADNTTVSQYSPFKKLFKLVNNTNIIDLKDNCDGFTWKNLVSSL